MKTRSIEKLGNGAIRPRKAGSGTDEKKMTLEME
jgi:hypothetical protein